MNPGTKMGRDADEIRMEREFLIMNRITATMSLSAAHTAED